MKDIRLIYILFVVLLGCESAFEYEPVIEEEVYFIDALVSNLADRNHVTINKLNSLGNMVPVSGAEVIVSDNFGYEAFYQQTEPGLYHSEVSGFPGAIYYLNVWVDGKHFHAATKMQEANQQFEITTKSSSWGTNIYYDYNQRLDKNEFYRFAFEINNQRYDSEQWLHVRHIDNGSRIFALADNLKLQSLDTVRVEAQSITQEVYQFYFDLLLYYKEQDNESLFAPNPFFPEGNISNAEGIFRASHIVSKELIYDKSEQF